MILIFCEDMGDVPPEWRHVNTVFQDYAVRDECAMNAVEAADGRYGSPKRVMASNEEMLRFVKPDGFAIASPRSYPVASGSGCLRALVNEPAKLGC